MHNELFQAYHPVAITLAPAAGSWHVAGLTGEAHDGANVGLTWGLKTQHPIKCRTVRNEEGGALVA